MPMSDNELVKGLIERASLAALFNFSASDWADTSDDPVSAFDSEHVTVCEQVADPIDGKRNVIRGADIEFNSRIVGEVPGNVPVNEPIEILEKVPLELRLCSIAAVVSRHARQIDAPEFICDLCYRPDQHFFCSKSYGQDFFL